MFEIADAINALFARYGLDHDVVFVDPETERLQLVNGGDADAMSLFQTTLEHLVACHFRLYPEDSQLRLF